MAEQNEELSLIRMNEVEATEIDWVWYPHIPYGIKSRSYRATPEMVEQPFYWQSPTAARLALRTQRDRQACGKREEGVRSIDETGCISGWSPPAGSLLGAAILPQTRSASHRN